MKDKIACICGNDVSTMGGCHKRGVHYFCRKCRRKITKVKIEQLVKALKQKEAR